MAKASRSTSVLPPQIAPRLLTIQQAAAYLGIRVWALRSLIWDGKLKPVQIGDSRRHLLAVEDLDSYIDAQRRVA